MPKNKIDHELARLHKGLTIESGEASINVSYNYVPPRPDKDNIFIGIIEEHNDACIGLTHAQAKELVVTINQLIEGTNDDGTGFGNRTN